MAVADCNDCSWRDDFDTLVDAGDAAERHERKEFHDVEVLRAATDGGPRPWVADCQHCGFRVVVEEGSLTRTPEERAKMSAGGHKSSHSNHEVDVEPVDDSGAKVHKCDICQTRFASVVDLINHDCDDHQDTPNVATDGGAVRREAIGATLASAGVGDQDPTCKHGTEGCPGPGGSWLDTCVECFFEGGENA